jgi:hypothetical protein
MVIVLFSISSLFAQSGKIAGTVVNQETKEPLAGENIVIEGIAMGASADIDGYYFIINVPPGVYSVTASFIGHQTVTQTNVQVSTNLTTPLEFNLSTSVLETEAIEVISERPIIQKDLTASERMITSDEIERTWVRTVEEAMNTQAGVFGGHIRGGALTETVYMLDNVSLNSGLLSDNYKGINISTIQEVNVLTGGYNAEYGNANSGIVNVSTKEASSGFNGTIIGRLRPAGEYHWGRNMYSKENYDWANFDLAYWTAESQNSRSQFFGEDPSELLSAWRQQITPDKVLAEYADRMQWETEFTFYGSATPKLGVLVSGRFKNGVGVYPSPLEYFPEYNVQTKLTYRFTDAMKLSFSGMWGGYETAAEPTTNFNSTESAQEAEWYGYLHLIDPYDENKYHMEGTFAQWPEERRVNNYALKWNHALSPKTFYEVNLSYLDDKTDKSDRDGILPTDRFSFDDDEFGMLDFFYTQGYFQRHDKFKSKVINLSGDITSQVNSHNLAKAGFLFRTFEFSYDHYMGAVEGGNRWNLMNVFDGTPYEGAVYVQDKIEYEGLIVNAGFRIDFFDQNRDAPANMFDPLAFQETTEGNITDGIPGNPVMESTEMQVAFSPRIGISHPITESSVLHFVYGHFNQRPSWNKMFGFPYITFSDNLDEIYDPYGPLESYPDQWMGFYGNPKMGYERTIQYEVGLDQNIADLIRLDITGYYKDGNRQTIFREGTFSDPRWDEPSPWTWLINASNQSNVHIMVGNLAFSDVRGIELQLDTRLDFPLNLSLIYDGSYTTGGLSGFNTLYELGSGIDVPQGFGQLKKTWNSNHKFKGWAHLYFGPGYFANLSPLNDVYLNLYYEYFTGPEYTYHGPGDTSTEPNNKRWEGHNRWNTKLAAGFDTWGLRTEVSLEVRNLFNNRTLNLLGGDDLINYEERGEKPNHWWSGEPDEWGWYNIYTNPKREFYFQVKVDF